MKSYDTGVGFGTHTVEVKLQDSNYKGIVHVKIKSNMKGLDVLTEIPNCFMDGTETECVRGVFEIDDEWAEIELVNEDGDIMQYQVEVDNELHDLIVGIKIIKFEKDED